MKKRWQPVPSARRAKAEPEAVTVNRTNFPDQPLALDAGDWIADGDGVKRMAQDRNGNMKEEYASRLPVLPLEILRNTEEGTEKIRLGFYKYGRWNNILVPRSSAASSVKIVELADMGLDVTSENARLLVKYLADVTSLNMDAIPVVKSCRHMGWTGESFLPYTDEIRLDSEAQYKDLIASVSSRGDLQAWIRFTAELRKNTVLRLLMGASFASPLIASVNALPFVLHLWGGSLGNGENLLNVGVSFALDKGVTTSKAAMARTIKAQGEKISEQDAKIQTLEAENAKLAERLAAIEAKLGK